MPRILQASDFYLKSTAAERDAALAVVAEVVEHARALCVDAVVIPGHLVSAAPDLVALGEPLGAMLARVPCAVYYLPGPGEWSLDGVAALTRAGQSVHVLPPTPWVWMPATQAFDLVGFLPALPSDAACSPALKQTRWRVALVQGAIEGFAATGDALPSLSPERLARFDVDYVAVAGLPSFAVDGPLPMASAGPGGMAGGGKTCVLVALGDGVSTTFVPLHCAGRARRWHVPVGLDGDIGVFPPLARWHAADRLSLYLDGIVVDDVAAERARGLLEQHVTGRAREICIHGETLLRLACPSQRLLLERVIEAFAQEQPPAADERGFSLWMQARRIALGHWAHRFGGGR